MSQQQQSISFAGKVVIITGAARGLGRAYAIEFAKRGAHVVVNDVDLKAAEETAKHICTLTGNSRSALANGSSVSTEAKALVDFTIEQFKTVHILINNAYVLREAYMAPSLYS